MIPNICHEGVPGLPNVRGLGSRSARCFTVIVRSMITMSIRITMTIITTYVLLLMLLWSLWVITIIRIILTIMTVSRAGTAERSMFSIKRVICSKHSHSPRRYIYSTQNVFTYVKRLNCMFGWNYLSNATCLIRPHLFYVCFVASRTTTICYITRHRLRKTCVRHIRLDIYMSQHVSAYAYAYIHTYIHTYLHTYIHTLHTCMYMYIHT